MSDSHAFSSHPGHGDAELTVAAAENHAQSDPRSYFPGQDDVEWDYNTDPKEKKFSG